MIDTKVHLTAALKNIWINDLYKDFCIYKPVAPENILKNKLLFIGINPSRSKKEELPKTSIERCAVSFYPQRQTAHHKYFKKFAIISEKTNIEWTHFDLLFAQETQQSIIKNILVKQSNGKEFIKEQLKVSRELFDLCEPKVIVVNNTLARDLMWGEMNMNFVFDEKIGTHLWGKTPVFFTSMLTGQRALDNGSFERLVWHIKRAINIIALKNN
jgi:hypothetical protein